MARILTLFFLLFFIAAPVSGVELDSDSPGRLNAAYGPLPQIISDSDGHTVTAAQANGSKIIEAGHQQTIVATTTPTAGMNFCVIADGADASATVYVDCDASAHFEYDGTSMANGEYIYNNSSLKGDIMCFTALSSTRWLVTWGGTTTVAEQTP